MTTALAIERLRQVIRRQHKALSTESTYVYWLRQYIVAVCKMPETFSSEQKLERYLTRDPIRISSTVNRRPIRDLTDRTAH